MFHKSRHRVVRASGQIGICTIITIAGCGDGDSSAPPTESEAQNSITRGPEGLSFNQGWRVDQHVRVARDVDADGKVDLVGFGNDGVWLMANQGNSFAAPTMVVAGLGNNQGFNNTNSIRTLADVNGDGRPDLVVFGPSSVQVSLKNPGAGYGAPSVWSTDYSAPAWNFTQHVLAVADVDADGKADIVGMDDWGVYVSRSLGTSFEPKRLWLHDFNNGSGWTVGQYPRLVIDINNDGRADVVGFGSAGVWASLSTGTSFALKQMVSQNFGSNDGWQVGPHLRVFANVDGDRYPDIVGIGVAGIFVAHGGPGGVFGEMALVDRTPRLATALAEGHCRLLAINRSAFLNLVKHSRRFAASLLAAVSARARYAASR